jgi:hypothetical protein
LEHLDAASLLALDHAFRYQKAASKPLYQAHIRDLYHEINCLRRSDPATRPSGWAWSVSARFRAEI